MQRFIAIVLLVAATVFLPGIGHAARLEVVSTTQDPAAIARAVGGDRVRVTALAKGYQDPHFLDAKPSYILEISRADLVLSVGLDMEVGYLPSLLTGARNPKVLPGAPGHLDLSTLIEPMEVMPNADRSQGDVHPQGNPHYWLDPENGRLMARGIAAKLTELDPAGKETYAKNLATFEKDLDAKMAEWTRRMEPWKGKPVVTFHKSWSYFAGRFGLEVIGFVEPKPGIPPSPRHTLDLIRTMRAKEAGLVMYESFYDGTVPKLLGEKTEARVVALPNSVGGDERVKTYFDLFDVIVGEITKGKKGAGD